MERRSKRTHKNYGRFNDDSTEPGRRMSAPRWFGQTLTSSAIFAVLIFILFNFYVFSSIVSLDSFLFVFLILSVLTDGMFLLLHLVRPAMKRRKYSFDPDKVSVVIACYNGADVIGETLKDLLKQFKPQNIIVVSDASTDNTEEVARSYGVRVIVNKKNLNKAFSVSIGVHGVKTPYVLLLDDDVLIGKATIPTNLMDEGYTAVAFNVMPIKTDTTANAMQMFEYRNSMHIGKNLRAGSSSIGNISGAIGLYRTKDLMEQAYLHTGQFAGEDEQRTLLAHMYGTGKGVTFSDETVHTHVPNTFHALFFQRAYSWSLAVPELMVLYFRTLFAPRYPFLLKMEKAYYIYIYLTDPLRMLFLWTLFLRPRYFVLTYVVYLVMNSLVWLKTRRKDPFLTVMLYPIYTLWLSICRFIGTFYWFKVKISYFAKRHHRMIRRRRVIAEFIVVLLLFTSAWAISGYHFFNDLRLFNKIRSSRLEETQQSFQYDTDASQKVTKTGTLALKFSQQPPAEGTFISVELEKGDTLRAIAHKAVDRYISAHPELQVPYSQRAAVDAQVLNQLQSGEVYFNNTTSMLLINNSVMQTAVTSQGGSNGSQT